MRAISGGVLHDVAQSLLILPELPGQAVPGDASEVARLHRFRQMYEDRGPHLSVGRIVPAPLVCTASILFTDLLAFTGLTKRFADDPRLLLQIPNTYLQKVLRSIAICGGEVEKLVGDGLMATFGASGRQRVHPVRRRGAQARLEIYRMSLLSGPAYKASTHGLAA